MTDQNHMEQKEERNDKKNDSKGEGDTEKETVRFCIEPEEVIDDMERERLKRDAKKYESVVDRLFAEDDCLRSTKKEDYKK